MTKQDASLILAKPLYVCLFCTIQFLKTIKHEIFQSRVAKISTDFAFTSSWSEYSGSPNKTWDVYNLFFSVQRKKCLQFAPRNLLPLNIFSLQRCLSLTHSARADQRITEVYFARRRDGFRIDQICSIWYLNNIFNKLSKTFVLLQISDDP